MLATLLVAITLGLQRSPNLVANPGLAAGQPGWAPLYTREPNTGTASTVPGRNGGFSVRVESTGDKDWAFYQQNSVPVHSGEVLEMTAWLKADAVSNGSIGLTTSDSAGKVLDWTYSSVATSGTHDWKLFSTRLVIPPQCASVRFRLVGYGKGKIWMSSPTLVRLGTISDFVKSPTAPLTLSTSHLTVTIGTDGGVSATDRKTQRGWKLSAGSPSLLPSHLRRTGPNSATLDLYSLRANQTYAVKYTLQTQSDDLDLSIGGEGPLPEGLSYPGCIATSAGNWLITPMNEGILFPVDDPAAPTLELVAYGGHGICMPWFGVVDPKSGAGVMEIIGTPDDATMKTERTPAGLLSPSTFWQSSKGQFAYVRKLKLIFLSRGGYVAEAKRYREYAKEQGLLVTLREKARRNPYVDRLIGAVNIWNWDMSVVPLAQSLKALGMDHVLWSRGGNPEELVALNHMGYLSSRYDIYQDVWDPKIALPWMNTRGWPQDLVWLPNGDWMRGWSHPDRQADGSIKWIQGGVISSPAGLKRAREIIPAELKDHPYHCRFLDTTTASPFREDYNPAHPMTRSDDRRNKMALLDYCSRELGLVVGSETGLDASVPYLDYFEGMMSLGPFRLPDAGTDMLAYRKPTPEFLKYQVGSYYRIPLWELVYHDCTVAQWYWGDATNKAPEVWDQRDLLNILYGTAPLLMFDQTRFTQQKERMKQTYENVCRWDRKVGYDELVSHEFLTLDHTVQTTTFSSGRSVIVNFGSKPWVKEKLVVPPLSAVKQG